MILSKQKRHTGYVNVIVETSNQLEVMLYLCTEQYLVDVGIMKLVQKMSEETILTNRAVQGCIKFGRE